MSSESLHVHSRELNGLRHADQMSISRSLVALSHQMASPKFAMIVDRALLTANPRGIFLFVMCNSLHLH